MSTHSHNVYSPAQWVKKQVVTRQLASPLGILLLCVLALAIGFLVVVDHAEIAIGISAVITGIIIVFFCLTRPLVGFYITIGIAFMAFYPGRVIGRDLPISTGLEVLFVLLFIGTIRFTSTVKKQKLLLTPVSIGLAVYTFFFLAQFFNTEMQSKAGWIFFFRRYVMFLLIYVIAYRLIDTKEKARMFFKYWVWLAFGTALYGCKQQWFGLFQFEWNSVMQNPLEYKLLFQGGFLRKFSFLSDAPSFGILCGSMAVFTLILALNEENKRRKRMYFLFVIIMAMGMSFSGSRTTVIMLPGGIALYGLMTINNKRTLVTLFGLALVLLVLLFGPVSTPALNRMRTAFQSKEESLNVRTENRHYIQPYIYTHPFGSGMATTGVDGERFNPNHALAGFPPDSGLLKYALETGWIGYILIMLFYFVVLYQGIYYFFRTSDPECKTYLAAITVTIFTLVITLFSTVSIGQIPGVIFFYSMLSIMKRLHEFGNETGNSKMITDYE